ncbi:sodium-dependent transporter [Methylosoma difficile]
MDTKKSVHGEWSSRTAFILAATGSAVGLGNIWKFPYITGENGGGAFVIVYLLCVALVGIPVMMAETMFGRRSRENPINTMQILTKEAAADEHWHYLGWMGVIAGMLILSYYSVIAGWACAYVVKSFTGSFFDINATGAKSLFVNFIASPGELMFWHTFFMFATLLIVARGISKGFEQSIRFLIPSLFVMLILLVGYAMSTDSYFKGLHFLFNFDFSKLTGNSVLIALGQAFFSLGIGMGAVMVYGAYLPKNVSILETTAIIAVADTVVALLAGIAIFPIVFSSGLPLDSGPGLIFESLPIAFGNMPGGWLFGTLFFIMLVFAALSSSIALIEPAVSWLVENKNMARNQACFYAGAATWVLGFGSVFSFNIGSDVTLFGKTFYDLLDYLTANLMLPIGGFCIAIFAGWMMLQKHSEQELAMGNPLHYQAWRVLIRYIAPAAIFFVFLHVVGVL